MSSYKGHTLFALILALLFSFNPLAISFTLIGANLSDFDHKMKKDKVYKIIIAGLVCFIILYILKLPYFIGLIIIYLGITFYFSEHRSFTHSIFAVVIFSILLSILAFSCYKIYPSEYTYLVVIILLSLLFLNKKILIPFYILLAISYIFLNMTSISFLWILFSLALGLFSHIVLDSFTPSGIKLFAPISSKTVYKKFGIVCIVFIILIAILYNFNKYFYLFQSLLV